MRHAFTLIELLVVIGILALLSAMLLPAITGASANARQVEDMSQMEELARGVLVWRSNIGKPSSLIFPRRIKDLADADKGGPLDGNQEVFVSPADPSGGQDPTFGAGNLSNQWADIFEPGCSYVYECSESPAPWDIDFAPSDVSVPDSPTWEEYKIAQKHYGNVDEDGEPAPFSEDVMPLLRNFYHHDWENTGTSDLNSTKRVLNATWSTRVYWSIPFWEHQANPAIPLP